MNPCYNIVWMGACVGACRLMCVHVCVSLYTVQVLWGPQSVFLAPNTAPQWLATAMCRVYLAVLYGLCEPVSMLLALFACVYSAQVRPAVCARP